jgi:hypothetical protein
MERFISFFCTLVSTVFTFISIVCSLLRRYTNNDTYIYCLRNNIFIRTTCFDNNGSSSGV